MSIILPTFVLKYNIYMVGYALLSWGMGIVKDLHTQLKKVNSNITVPQSFQPGNTLMDSPLQSNTPE